VTDATYAPANLGDLTTTPTRTHKCGPGGSYTFKVEVQPKTTVTAPGSSSTGTLGDHNTASQTGASTRTDYLIELSQLLPPSVEPKAVTISSSDESVIASPDDGLAIGQASGTANIIARSADGEVSVQPVTISVATAQTVTFATGPADGSLNKHCYDQIETRIAGRDRSSMDLWSTRNNAAPSYVWSENCWGADLVNKTCMSPYNTRTGNGGGGALVTPRHVVFTHHVSYYPKVGDRIRYVTPANVTEQFTVEALEIHPYSVGYFIAPWDIVVVKLDRDVPSSINFAKVLPEDPTPYLPTMPVDQTGPQPLIFYSNGVWPWLRACHTTQNKRLATAYMRILSDAVAEYPYNIQSSSSPVKYVTGTTGWQIDRYPDNPLGDPVVSGDSGAPAFIVVNNELVLTSLWSTPTAGFPYYADASIINAMINDAGNPDGYSLTEVDLTEFPTY